MKKKTLVILSVIITIMLIIILIIIASDFHLYKEADSNQEKYTDMAEEVRMQSSKKEKMPKYILIEGTEDVLISPSDSDKNLSPRIDFSKLEEQEINKDETYAWLYIPDSPIDYVVMKAPDKDPLKYLWKDPYGKESNTGSLFITDTGDDDHTIIYGHRLKNHDIYFGPLFEFISKDYAEKHEFAYLYEQDRVTKYKLFSVNEGLETDSVYYYPYKKDTSDYSILIDEIKDSASVILQENFDNTKKMLVLSTCSGDSSGQPQRLYLVYQEDIVCKYQ